MGFRFRKSRKLGGGFRVNISKSGIGYSWGIKGVRFTKTAKRRNRITNSIPGSGISYSTEFGHINKTKSTRKHPTFSQSNANLPYEARSYSEYINEHGVTNIRDWNSSSPDQLQSAEFSEFIDGIKRYRLIVLFVLIISVIFLFILPIISIVLLIGLTIFIVKQKISLEYEFDEYSENIWNRKNESFHSLKDCKAIWYVTKVADVDSRRNAGAKGGQDVKKAKINYHGTLNLISSPLS